MKSSKSGTRKGSKKASRKTESNLAKQGEENTTTNNNNTDETQNLKENLKKPKSDQKSNSQPNQEPTAEEAEKNAEMRIFNYELVKLYWKNQQPANPGEKFIDQLFPPITESILDKRIKTQGVDLINMHEIDWKKSSEIISSKNLSIFPIKSEQEPEEKQENNETKEAQEPKQEEEKKIQKEVASEKPAELPLSINYNDNKGSLFNHYSQFFQAVEILMTYPTVIQQVFKTKEINKEGCYELYVYVNGEYKIVVLDDYFPVVKGTVSPRFAKPVKDELWLMLLEKAYAKVNGGYASLLKCTLSSVLICFTGFACERLNFFDVDLEDLENAIRVNKDTNVITCYPNNNGIKNGLIPLKGYQLINIFDIRTKDENGNEVNLKLIKMKNMFEYDKYRGDWCAESPLWNEDVKRVINYRENEKEMIYASLDNFFTYFEKIEIIHTMFSCNSKIITIENTDDDQDKIRTPQCFNLYLPTPAKVSLSLVLLTQSLDIETTDYARDLTVYEKLSPSTLCISKYDPETKKFSNFEGNFSSNNNCEFARELETGYYVIWAYLAEDFCKDPKPDKFYLKVSSAANFKLRLQTADYKFHLIKEMVMSGIRQYQGEHIKDTEIYTMNDSYYNYSGLGLKVVINPFAECFQKWIFQPDLDNMLLLYPYTQSAQFEVEVKPNNYILILGMKIDESQKCEFKLKSNFKTYKYISESEIEKQKSAFNFIEFCSKDVESDKMEGNYYNYLNDEQNPENNPEEKTEEQQQKEDPEKSGKEINTNQSVTIEKPPENLQNTQKSVEVQ